MSYQIIIQIIISLLFSLMVLLQNKGASLGSIGGGFGDNSIKTQKRGGEKFLHFFTIFLAVLFCLNAFLIGRF